jgi:hypothetical protein
VEKPTLSLLVSVTEARWGGQSVCYPPYSYVDLLGGQGSISY